eukprot:PhM_4_TR9242/c0_g1_i2/m.24400
MSALILNNVVFKPTAAAATNPKHCAVLIHGMTSAHQTFLSVMQAIADRASIDVVGVDLRGHGASPEPEDATAYGLEEMAGDVAATVRSLGYDKVLVLGHSWGSRVAMQFAACHTDMTLGVLVEDEFMDADAASLAESPAVAPEELAREAAAKKSQWVAAFDTYESCEGFLTTVFGPPSRIGQQDYSRKILKKAGTPTDTYVPLFKPHATYVWNEVCRKADMNFVWRDTVKYPMPVRIMAGGDPTSADIKPPMFEKLSSEVASMAQPELRSIVRIDGSEHTIHRTHPDEFLADFVAYITAVEKRSK